MAVQFTCPHCGMATDVAEQYVGRTGPCTRCGQTVTVPSPDGATPFAAATTPKRGLSTGWIGLIVIAVALLMCGGVLTALLLPAVQAAREATQSRECMRNLKRITLGLLNYEQAHGCFPPAYIPDKNGRPMHSWRVLILPFLEQKGLYDQYRFDEPWDSPTNRRVARMAVKVFQCPAAPHDPNSFTTDYMMVVGPHTFSDGPHGRRIADITDGTSNTIMVVEVANSGVLWNEPKDLPFDQMTFNINGEDRPCIGSHHPGGANVSFTDGSVHFPSDSMDPHVIMEMLTVDGGEEVHAGPDF